MIMEEAIYNFKIPQEKYLPIETNFTFITDYHEWLFEQIRCPNCGKILKPHICGEED